MHVYTSKESAACKQRLVYDVFVSMLCLIKQHPNVHGAVLAVHSLNMAIHELLVGLKSLVQVCEATSES